MANKLADRISPFDRLLVKAGDAARKAVGVAATAGIREVDKLPAAVNRGFDRIENYLAQAPAAAIDRSEKWLEKRLDKAEAKINERVAEEVKNAQDEVDKLGVKTTEAANKLADRLGPLAGPAKKAIAPLIKDGQDFLKESINKGSAVITGKIGKLKQQSKELLTQTAAKLKENVNKFIQEELKTPGTLLNTARQLWTDFRKTAIDDVVALCERATKALEPYTKPGKGTPASAEKATAKAGLEVKYQPQDSKVIVGKPPPSPSAKPELAAKIGGELPFASYEGYKKDYTWPASPGGWAKSAEVKAATAEAQAKLEASYGKDGLALEAAMGAAAAAATVSGTMTSPDGNTQLKGTVKALSVGGEASLKIGKDGFGGAAAVNLDLVNVTAERTQKIKVADIYAATFGKPLGLIWPELATLKEGLLPQDYDEIELEGRLDAAVGVGAQASLGGGKPASLSIYRGVRLGGGINVKLL